MNTPSRSTALLSQLGIGAPIIQAPMAGVATPALAAAVSNAGGLGSLGLGAMNADAARKAIRDTRAQTDAPFNVNVFCHAPAIANETIEAQWLDWLAPEFARLGATPPEKLGEIYTSFLADDAMLDMLLDEKPPVVSFHFGLPGREAIAALKRAGITLLASATNLDEAKSIADAQLDAVIAQGIEAGGHRGMFDPAAFDDGLGTFALTRLLVRHIDLPVISAGGIMDGAGIVAALALGAQAAQMGTAFVACPETSSDGGYRAAMTGEPARHTVLTPAISGRPARSMVNRMTDLVHSANAPRLPAYPIAYDAAKALMNAAKAAGESNYGGQWAGQGAPLARAMPAAELVSQLKREMAVAVRALQAIEV